MVNSKANPRILQKKKKKKKNQNPKIHCKSLNQKPQITNQISLKQTQRQKRQQTNRATQPTLQHKPTDGSGIAASKIGQPTQLELQSRAHCIRIQASEIAHWIGSEIAVRSHRSARSCRLLCSPSHGLLRRSSLSLLRCSLNLNLKVFHNFSLFLFSFFIFFSLTSSVSLSLYLKN